MRVNEITQIDFNNAFRYFSNPAAQSYIIYEHNYCIPNDAQKQEDDSRTAIKYLFINPHLQEKLEKSYGDDVVDVESTEDQKVPELINIMCDAGDENDWIEKVDKKGWNNSKQHLFKSIVEIIEADYLTRLSSEGLPNMIVKQRLMSNKTAVRLRRLFSAMSWNAQLLQWVHGLLMDNLPRYLMNIYQDALQYLETKVQPHLMDIILSSNRGRVGNSESQNKKSLDPYLDQLTQKKPAKLVGGPLLIVVPFNTGGGYPANSRQHRWTTEFSHLSTVITLTCTKNNVPTSSMDVNALLDQMVKETRLKIAELRSDYPYKPIVLLGIDSGSAIACHVAMVEKVSAVVCLGFPLLTADGKRGEENDKLLELRTPTLFIIGQNATIASVADMQELRLKLNCKSSLIVVGGTDDNLRSSHYLRMKECITQSVVDRCILIEISLFLNEVLSAPPSSSVSSNQQTNSSTVTGMDDYKRSSIGSSSLHLKKMLSATPVRRQRIVTQKKNDNDLNMNIGYGLSVSNNNDNSAASESQQFSSSSSFSKPLIKADPAIFASFEKAKLPKPVVPGSQNLYTNMEFIEQNSGSNTGGNSFLSLSTSNVNNLYNKLDINKSTLPSSSNQSANKRLSNSSVITISTQSGTITIDNTRDRKADNATRTKRRYVRRIPFEKRRRSAIDPLLHSFPFSNSNSYSQSIKTLNTTPARVSSSTSTATSVKPSIVTLTPDSILDLPVVFADDNEVNAAVSNIPGFSS